MNEFEKEIKGNMVYTLMIEEVSRNSLVKPLEVGVMLEEFQIVVLLSSLIPCPLRLISSMSNILSNLLSSLMSCILCLTSNMS